MAELPQENELSRYKVPLLIYSPLLKVNKEIKSIASHADIAPSLISLLNKKYSLNSNHFDYSISVNNSIKGMYILKISNSLGSISKKITFN